MSAVITLKTQSSPFLHCCPYLPRTRGVTHSFTALSDLIPPPRSWWCMPSSLLAYLFSLYLWYLCTFSLSLDSAFLRQRRSLDLVPYCYSSLFPTRKLNSIYHFRVYFSISLCTFYLHLLLSFYIFYLSFAPRSSLLVLSPLSLLLSSFQIVLICHSPQIIFIFLFIILK